MLPMLLRCGAVQEEKAAMKKLGPKLEVSPATKRLWQELKQEIVSITTRLYKISSLPALG